MEAEGEPSEDEKYQLEYYGMPAGTPIWVEGLGDGSYLQFKRNFIGANEHTVCSAAAPPRLSIAERGAAALCVLRQIDFTGPVPGPQTLNLTKLHWRVPGGVPGTQNHFASRRPSQEFRPNGSAPPTIVRQPNAARPAALALRAPRPVASPGRRLCFHERCVRCVLLCGVLSPGRSERGGGRATDRRA